MSWSDLRTPLCVLSLAVLLGALSACSTPRAPTAWPGDGEPERPWGQRPSKIRAETPPTTPTASTALTDQAYRRDAARHLYARQSERIYPGRLPPMLYAVGVLHVDIGPVGQVQALRWARAPRHAPEVMVEIEQMVRAAAPFPAPRAQRQLTYTDVWLWDRSGRFQLDTLTEGQD